MSKERSEKIDALEQKRLDTNAPEVGKQDKIGDEFEMKVVCNAGDPGLSEHWFFDILSRFVICMKEPCSKVPTNSTKWKQFFLVKRPRHLWIDCPSSPDLTVDNRHASTRRKDYEGNINIGHTSNFSINTIPQIDAPYGVGETITVRKTAREFAGKHDVFNSQFENTDFDNYYDTANALKSGAKRKGETGVQSNELQEIMEYSSAYLTNYGSGTNPTVRGAALYQKLKPLMAAHKRYGAPVLATKGHVSTESEAIGNVASNNFFLILHYYAIDYFLGITNPAYSGTVTALSQGEHRYQKGVGSSVKHHTTGKMQAGFPLFKQSMKPIPGGNSNPVDGSPAQEVLADKRYINVNMPFSFCEYEDVNSGDKKRVTRDECMPLVIASPNNFPTPKERAIGSIIYQPAYATVVAAQNP